MALVMAITTEHGIELPEAYARIDEQSGNKVEVTMRLRFYASKASAQEGKAWIEEKVISYTPSVDDGADNFIKQGYEYLKTLVEYVAAVDDIE
ncbi:hypothetical protein [Paenibacillus sp. FSL R7-0337]|uniref:hypothetical protein n=1 Tax=Paenibacillus sp. FSL R7-0337 TaxID=1926588 RepID=UPI00096FA278|nr:hypothetical protein [Paenibacillus sp. FSL R7-0337]OMF98180.1 hypothetical protein BK147_11200 [Paenibacillus sp. FSL R7-0337]